MFRSRDFVFRRTHGDLAGGRTKDETDGVSGCRRVRPGVPELDGPRTGSAVGELGGRGDAQRLYGHARVGAGV